MLAPEAVNVEPKELQIVPVPEIVKVGNGLTVTVRAATLVLVQPAVLVPVTVYEAVLVGEKATALVAVPAEADHVYVLAPLPFNVTDCPIQIAELVAAAVTEGRAFTVTVTTALLVLVQPVSVLVPTTV